MDQAPAHEAQQQTPWGTLRWWAGLLLGLVGFGLLVLLPPLPVLYQAVGALGVASEHLQPVAVSIQRVFALLWWMLWWWVGEVVPLPVTALLPAVVGPLLGLVRVQGEEVQALPLRSFLHGYADPIVLLFLGSFIVAEALREYGLDQRWALWLLSRRWVVQTPHRLLLSVMAATAALSMWMNNTATAAMLMPVVVGILAHVRTQLPAAVLQRLGMALVLGVAWAASIGGMMTIVGTAPNGIAVGVLRQHALELSFLGWLQYGVPAGVGLLVVGWRVLLWRARVAQVPLHTMYDRVIEYYRHLPPLEPAAWRVLFVFAGVVLGWLVTPFLAELVPALKGFDIWSIALAGAMALFVIPAPRQRGALLSWKAAQRIEWGTLLLFGGGLSLSGLLVETKAAAVVAQVLIGISEWVPPVVLLFVLLLGANFGTEVMSNTALVALLLPLIVPLVVAVGLPVKATLVAMAMVSSCAFMLPVATPPNAIAYTTGLVRLPDMVRVGVLMNCISTLVLTALVLVSLGGGG